MAITSIRRASLLLFAFCTVPLQCLYGYSDTKASLTDQSCDSFDQEEVDFGDFDEGNWNCGQEVQLDKVNSPEAPTVTYKSAVPGQKYLIAMVDPDAPFKDNPIFKSWLHWIVGNVDGNDLGKGNTFNGDTFTAYNPPTPPKPKPGTHNDHRYFIYVFQQGHMLDSNAEVKSRKNFDVDAYMEDFDLQPVAMNMFRTHS
ncbi:protein D2-like isoform X1 [Acropora palmata]|uniref:protein D2-like isoform X1 n=1 Tax=Acropora palmata TaxID=6131 RepID=UPI003DA17AC1